MFKSLLIVLLLTLAACGDSGMITNKPSITFEVNTPVTNAFSASSVDFQKDCMLRLCMYEFSLAFSEPLRANLEALSTTGALKFNDVIRTTLITFNGDNIDKANVTLGGVQPNSQHSEAIRYFYQQTEKLLAEGWVRYIFPNEARLSGAVAKEFEDPESILNHPVSTGPWADPNLRLNRNQWLALPIFSSWYFYKDGVYLLLRVQRENSAKSPNETGSYLFTFTFESEAEFYKGFVENKLREDWKQLLPAELKRMAQERAQTEARLKKMGIAIDEDYQDPPIKALE